jgi:hypothetical protein
LRYFSDSNRIRGSFGDEGDNREELLEKAIHETQKSNKDFTIIRDSLGFAQNIYYIADSKTDFYAGLNCKIRSIWIPSRIAHDVKELANEISTKYILDLLGNRVLMTNNLSSLEVMNMLGLN